MERGAELYNKYLRGDNEALEQLVIGYGDRLIGYAYCFLHDFAAAEDVMEDTFATLIVKRKRFISRAPFEAYLFRIARNKCLDRLRKAKRETRLDGIELAAAVDIEDDALKVVRDEKVYKSMLTLPHRAVSYVLPRLYGRRDCLGTRQKQKAGVQSPIARQSRPQTIID